MDSNPAHCKALVRAADKDRFLATLFAPAEHRGALFALYAFNLEVARVREVVRDPLAGEIRLQWWSDVLHGADRGEVEAHPVAAALRATIARYALPVARFEALDSYALGASADLIALAANILGDSRASDELIRHAGQAHAMAGLLKALPVHAARGQVFVPLELLERHGADRQAVMSRQASPQLRAALAEMRLHARRHLAAARDLIAAAPSAVMPALLPVALAEPTLARMDRRDYDPFVPVEISLWWRQWLIWRAAKRPARIFG
jgi:phytoene synthase